MDVYDAAMYLRLQDLGGREVCTISTGVCPLQQVSCRGTSCWWTFDGVPKKLRTAEDFALANDMQREILEHNDEVTNWYLKAFDHSRAEWIRCVDTLHDLAVSAGCGSVTAPTDGVRAAMDLTEPLSAAFTLRPFTSQPYVGSPYLKSRQHPQPAAEKPTP